MLIQEDIGNINVTKTPSYPLNKTGIDKCGGDDRNNHVVIHGDNID